MTVVLGLILYGLLVLGVGLATARRSSREPVEYFLAGRGLGPFVLFMALFGTNCTAFVLVGIPGQSYHSGLATFGLNAPLVALGVPLTFFAIGVPAQRLAAELGALTPAELYSKRLGSRAVGIALFGVFTLYTLPYMVTAVDGAAVTLASATDGAIPRFAGGVLVMLVALVYTSLGGMRATAWTNVVQGSLFLGFVLCAVTVYARGVGGGFAGSFERLAAERPALMVAPDAPLFEPRAFASWGLVISTTVIAFPHMLARLMAARDDRALRITCRTYPVALVLLWLPVVLIGTFGALQFPGLEGRDADRIFSLMAAEFLGPELAVLAIVAVLAAVMSTLDAQILTLGSMLTRDVLPGHRSNERGDVWIGRGFGALMAVLVVLVWQVAGASIFKLASLSFSGYVTLVPVLFLGVRWSGLTARGALASIALGNGAYFAALAAAGGMDKALAPSWLGFLPAVWGFGAATVAALVVSSLGREEGA